MILLDTDHLSVLRFRSGERCVRLIARRREKELARKTLALEPGEDTCSTPTT